MKERDRKRKREREREGGMGQQGSTRREKDHKSLSVEILITMLREEFLLLTHVQYSLLRLRLKLRPYSF